MKSELTKLAQAAGFALAMALTLSCTSGNSDGDNGEGGGGGGGGGSEYKGGSCDASDYGEVEIDEQVWMAKNWGCYAPGSKCYENATHNCNKYGRLYDWETARTVCPDGWHLPSNAEWTTLEQFVDQSITTLNAGTKLKATSGWNNDGNKSGNGTDDFGFAALPGGYVDASQYSDGNFVYAGQRGRWWSSSEDNSCCAYGRVILYDNSRVYSAYYDTNHKKRSYSVRCVKD